jgi:hypothetical protein
MMRSHEPQRLVFGHGIFIGIREKRLLCGSFHDRFCSSSYALRRKTRQMPKAITALMTP